MTDDEFDALLASTLAPPARPADRAFVARIDGAVAEVARFRAWRRRALRHLGSEALILFALAGTGMTISRAPGVAEAMTTAPLALPAAIGGVLVLWLTLSPQRGRALGL